MWAVQNTLHRLVDLADTKNYDMVISNEFLSLYAQVDSVHAILMFKSCTSFPEGEANKG